MISTTTYYFFRVFEQIRNCDKLFIELLSLSKTHVYVNLLHSRLLSRREWFAFIMICIKLTRENVVSTSGTHSESAHLVLPWNGNYAIPKRQLMQPTRSNDR